MPSDRSASDVDDQSVLGEEDPGAALDTVFGGPEALVPLPTLGLPEVAAPMSGGPLGLAVVAQTFDPHGRRVGHRGRGRSR